MNSKHRTLFIMFCQSLVQQDTGVPFELYIKSNHTCRLSIKNAQSPEQLLTSKHDFVRRAMRQVLEFERYERLAHRHAERVRCHREAPSEKWCAIQNVILKHKKRIFIEGRAIWQKYIANDP